LLTHEVVSLADHEGILGVTLTDGSEIRSHSLVIATGVSYRRLAVPGSDLLTGRGVYYGAAMVEASSIQGEDVYIVGGANSAGQAAIYFADVARSVTMLVRGTALSASMSQYLIEHIERTPNIVLRFQSEIAEVRGDERLESLVLKNSSTGDVETVAASALFVFIGASPRTEWLDGCVARDEKGFILTGPDLVANGRPRNWKLSRDPLLLETNIPGVFAAGDVRHGSGKRVATAVGEGAMAVMSIWQYRAQAGL
ncbi:MAG TPA: NAD(P)/FAD-dependent oxidoreductase, partial [Thermomicrobiales bacterium]|nr:NAD(P)/FAD-dependent oxidoreductase [Thermomicrobiales bacterium]